MKKIARSLALCLLAGAMSLAAAPEEGMSGAEIVQRIVELRHELDDLLAALPPELREEVDRQLGTVAEPAADASRGGGLAGGPGREPSAGDLEPPSVEDQLPGVESVEGPACLPLGPFDTNGDGELSGLDRSWRFFKAWIDNGDGTIDAGELKGLYDAGVARLDATLQSLTGVDGRRGEVRIGDQVTLELPRKKHLVAVLVLDADRLWRSGEIELFDARGRRLDGWQALGATTRLGRPGGERWPLECPRDR